MVEMSRDRIGDECNVIQGLEAKAWLSFLGRLNSV